MESLLVTFLSVLFALCGDRSQILAAELAKRFGSDSSVLRGAVLASFANCAVSAFAGRWIGQTISEDPVRLLTGLAYIFAGVAMLWQWKWRRPDDMLQRWRLGPFLTSFLGIFVIQFGDKGQFIILAQSANSHIWGFTAVGGVLGVIAALVPAILLKEKLLQSIALPKIRKSAGILFIGIGCYLALRAWHLI